MKWFSSPTTSCNFFRARYTSKNAPYLRWVATGTLDDSDTAAACKKRSLDSDKRGKSLHFPSFLVSHRHRSTVVRWLSYEYVKCYLRTIPRAYSLLFFPLAYVIFFHPSRCIYGVCMFLSCIYFFRIFFSRLLPIQRRRRQKSEKTEQKKKDFFYNNTSVIIKLDIFFSSFLFFSSFQRFNNFLCALRAAQRVIGMGPRRRRCGSWLWDRCDFNHCKSQGSKSTRSKSRR